MEVVFFLSIKIYFWKQTICFTGNIKEAYTIQVYNIVLCTSYHIELGELGRIISPLGVCFYVELFLANIQIVALT